MPDQAKKVKMKGGSQHFDWPLNGKFRNDVDAALIGETNFQTLVNFRYTTDGITGIQGMTPINVAAIPYTNLSNAYHFRKDRPPETHVFVQGVSGVNSILYKSNNTALIPAQDTFSSFQTLDNNSTVNFSEAPDGAMAVCNGVTNRIWSGNEGRCSSFIVYDPSGTFWYDYTDKVTNTLSDAADVARVALSGGGIDGGCKALWRWYSIGSYVDDYSVNGHTMTNQGSPSSSSYPNSRFGATDFFAWTLPGSAYTSVAAHADFDLSGNIYTVEGVYNVTSLAAINPLYYQNTTSDADSFSVYIDTDGSVKLVVKKTASGTFTATTSAGVVTAGKTCHIAVVQNSTILYIFVDGYLKFQGTAPTTIQNYTGTVNLGYNGTVYFVGWMEEVRLSNVARWILPFTPSTSGYSISTAVANIYVGSVRPLQGVKFYIGTANGTAAVATAFQWTGASWDSMTITDNTAIGGKTLAKTGEISFASTVGQSKVKAIRRGVAYYYQFVFTGVDASTTIYYCTLDAPMQAVTDLWDGSSRQTLQCYTYTTAYSDVTPNVAPSTSSVPRAYYVSDSTSYAQFGGLTSSQYIYCGYAQRILGLIISMPDAAYVNTVANTVISVDYWSGRAWTTVGAVDDSTSSGNISFNHSGLVTWNAATENTEFTTSVATDFQLYYYRVHFSKTLTADVRVDEIGGITAQLEILPYKFSMLWQNRLWLFGGQAQRKNTALCSGYGTNTAFNGDDSLELEFGDDKEVVAASTLFSRFSSGIYDDLLVLKRSSVYMVDGNGPSTWITYTISDSVGCIAPQTVQRCDVSYSVSEGMTKHVVIWRSSRAVEFFDGNSLSSIKEDIQSFFDPSSSDYIDPNVYDVSQETSFFDDNLYEYHWIFTNANGKQEWVYNLKLKKWSKFDRGTGKYLNNGFPVQDLQGNDYNYGLTNDGFMEHLTHGTTFDGNPIVYTFRTGDNLLGHTGNYITKLRHVKLIAKVKNISAATVSLTHYADTSSSGTSMPAMSQKDSTHRLYQAKHSVNIDALLHSLLYTVTTDNETIGFEPLLISGLWDIVREDVR